MLISTTLLERSLQTLERSLKQLNSVDDASDIDYEVYRNAVIKGFELYLEVCGKLLRKALKAYGGSPKPPIHIAERLKEMFGEGSDAGTP